VAHVDNHNNNNYYYYCNLFRFPFIIIFVPLALYFFRKIVGFRTRYAHDDNIIVMYDHKYLRSTMSADIRHDNTTVIIIWNSVLFIYLYGHIHNIIVMDISAWYRGGEVRSIWHSTRSTRLWQDNRRTSGCWLLCRDKW